MTDCCAESPRLKMELTFASFCCLLGLFVVALIILKRFAPKSKKSKSVPPGVVLLHQFKPNPKIVNMSPPCLKLETFLRMAKIPYESDYGFGTSSKGKVPWIEYNGQDIADSNFCIEFLCKEFGIDVDNHLSEEQKSIATAMRVMLEENTYWTVVHYRWISEYAPEFKNMVLGFLPFPLRDLLFWHFQRKARGCLHGHGIGRHSVKEIYAIAERDLRAVSVYLGQKKFFFGDKPSLIDAVLFALVGNFIWQMPQSPQEKLILTQLNNLADHSQRMKDTFYLDWNEIVSGKKKSA